MSSDEPESDASGDVISRYNVLTGKSYVISLQFRFSGVELPSAVVTTSTLPVALPARRENRGKFYCSPYA
jgi:hypothetical protein